MTTEKHESAGCVEDSLKRIDSALETRSRMCDKGLLLDVVDAPGIGALEIVKLLGTDKNLTQMDLLYRDGFGDAFPFPMELHELIIKRGVVVGAFDNAGELCGMWAIFLDYRDGHPVDPPVLSRHAGAAYLSHSVVSERLRGNGINSMLARACIELVNEDLLPGMRASVSPWNFPSLGTFFKTGFSAVDFCPNLYGRNKHRFHVMFTKDDVNKAYNFKEEVLKNVVFMENEKGYPEKCTKYLAVSMDSKSRSNISALHNMINVNGCRGVMLLSPGEVEKYAPMDHTADAFLLVESSSQKKIS